MDDRMFTYSESEVRDLVLKIHPRIVPYIRSLLSRGGQRPAAINNAEDIFYDVLCNFLDKHIESSSDKVPAYLFKAVRNRCHNILNRNKEENSAVRLDDMPLSAREIIAAADFDEDSDFGFEEDIVIGSEKATPSLDISAILDFSNYLPERTRDIFYMSRIEGMTHAEIAEALGISTRAVEKHLQNSVQEYRRHFGKPNGRHHPS